MRSIVREPGPVGRPSAIPGVVTVPFVTAPAGLFTPVPLPRRSGDLAAVFAATGVEATLVDPGRAQHGRRCPPLPVGPTNSTATATRDRDVVAVIGITPDGTPVCCLTLAGDLIERAQAERLLAPDRPAGGPRRRPRGSDGGGPQRGARRLRARASRTWRLASRASRTRASRNDDLQPVARPARHRRCRCWCSRSSALRRRSVGDGRPDRRAATGRRSRSVGGRRDRPARLRCRRVNERRGLSRAAAVLGQALAGMAGLAGMVGPIARAGRFRRDCRSGARRGHGPAPARRKHAVRLDPAVDGIGAARAGPERRTVRARRPRHRGAGHVRMRAAAGVAGSASSCSSPWSVGRCRSSSITPSRSAADQDRAWVTGDNAEVSYGLGGFTENVIYQPGARRDLHARVRRSAIPGACR